MELARYLRWDAGPDVAALYEGAFERRAEERLSAAVSRLAEPLPRVAESLATVAAEIPSSSLLRVAVAPELEYRLRGAEVEADGVASLASFLCESFEAELLLLNGGDAPRTSGEVWTALGDRGFVGGRVVKSPTVGAGLPVDFLSPHGRGDVALRFPECERFAARERRAVVTRLGEACEVVGGAGAEVARFVATFTKVLVPLKVRSLGPQFGSFSSSWYPGRSVLVNPASPKMPVTERAAALVHEAIHSVIDASELGGRLLVEGRPCAGTVTSPWTGATLSLQSLLDAYFVWFGLMWFWARVAESGAVGREVCEGYVRLCAKGFGPEFGAVVGEEALPSVHPFTRESIEGLRGDVLAAV